MNEYVLESKENLNYFYRNLNETEINQFVDILIQHKDNNIYFLGGLLFLSIIFLLTASLTRPAK